MLLRLFSIDTGLGCGTFLRCDVFHHGAIGLQERELRNESCHTTHACSTQATWHAHTNEALSNKEPATSVCRWHLASVLISSTNDAYAYCPHPFSPLPSGMQLPFPNPFPPFLNFALLLSRQAVALLHILT